MWPAYLAALLLSLPAPPAQARDGAPRSALDRSHLGEETPPAAGGAVRAAMAEKDDEEERDGDA